MLMDPGVRGKHDWHDGADGSAGSPAAFLAPEQVLGHPPAPAVDIYALGAVLFWLLGGELPPYQQRGAAQLGRFLPLPEFPKKANSRLAAIGKQAAAIRVTARYPSMELLRAALHDNARELDAAQQSVERGSRHTLVGQHLHISSGLAAGGRSVQHRWMDRWIQGLGL
jgi:serine/threonine protein kinase